MEVFKLKLLRKLKLIIAFFYYTGCDMIENR